MQAKSIQISGMVIRYDRSGSEWLVEENGRVVERLPPGPAGKEAAIAEAIKLAAPELHQMARYMALKNPVLRSRVWKAAQLAANGHVLPPRPGNLVGEVSQVLSETDEAIIYSIQYRDCHLCSCEDYQFEKAPRLASGQKYCKHILAHAMHQRRQQMAQVKQEQMEEMAYA